MAQRKASTPPLAFDMDATRLPANINLIPGTLEFIDNNDDHTIGANEHCTVRFQISNTGLGDGVGCVARISADGNTQGLLFSSFTLPVIKHNEKMWIEFPIVSNRDTEDGIVQFKMEVYEPHGLGTGDIYLEVPTYHFVSPLVKVTDYRPLGDKSILQRKEKFTLQVMVKNVDYGTANDVGVSLSIPNGLTLLSNNNVLRIDQLLPNEEKIIEYDLIAAVNAPEKLDFMVTLSEKYRLYAEDRQITLRFDDKLFSYSDKITSTREKVDIEGGRLTSEVDNNIPKSHNNNTNTYVVIIANENYQSVAYVPFARNDGIIFREYCIKTLGVPEDNVSYIDDATANQIKSEVKWLQDICNTHKDVQIIFYYSGHGIPDVKNSSAYILPIDGIGTDVSTGYKLDDLYASLGNVPAKSVTIFMDACFSGSTRTGSKDMLVTAKGVAIKAKSGMPQGNMVVFSAAQGDETAYPYYKEKHSMFTYFLLKKLQDTNGNVTLQELGNYLITEVSKRGSELRQPQTPCVTPSASLDDSWREWKLK